MSSNSSLTIVCGESSSSTYCLSRILKNGKYTRQPNASNPNWKKPAKKLPVDNQPEKKIGVVHGSAIPVV